MGKFFYTPKPNDMIINKKQYKCQNCGKKRWFKFKKCDECGSEQDT